MGASVITLRAATEDDIPAIDRVLSQTYPRLLKADYRPSTMVLAVPLFARANPALVRAGSYYVAEGPEGELLGAGGWSFKGGGEVAEIRHFVTHWAHLRQGVGRRIMDGVVSAAETFGVTRLECLSTRTAVPFYRAVGFEVRGSVKVPLRPGIEFPAILMRRPV